MKKLTLTIIVSFITVCSFCQTHGPIFIGETTYQSKWLYDLKAGDKMRLDFPMKTPWGTLKIGNDNNLYERGGCEDKNIERKKRVEWCKIGSWKNDDKELVFTLPTRTIKFSYSVFEPGAPQVIIVKDVQ